MLPSLNHEQIVSGPPVPCDRFLDSGHAFISPSKEEVSRVFYTAHEISEELYQGNGVWHGDSELPLVRFTSRRVIGYIVAYHALGDEVFRHRALEGLEHLLREQNTSGTFVWYNRSLRGIDNRDDGLYETAIAGAALVEGYRHFGDERYLAASERAARWAIDCPISWNNNYNMFTVWHLAEHYRETADQSLLDAAIYRTREGGLPGQFESGGWPGHNSWSWYHGIIIRGMAALYNVLSVDHPFRDELRPPLVAAINRMIREQDETGHVPANPGVVDNEHRMAHVLHGLLLARESFGSVLDNCIRGLERLRISTQPKTAEVEEFKRARREWNTLLAEASKHVLDEGVWSDGFESFRADPEWGEVAEGWFNCWYPMNEPSRERIAWTRCSIEQRSGTACQKYTGTAPRVFSGIGFEVPKGVLVTGDAYRFGVWAKCHESDGAKGRIDLIYASAYSGPARESWDCLTDCTIWNEGPAFGEYAKLSVPFTAAGDTNYLYVWLRADSVPEGEVVSMFLDDVELIHEGKPLPKWESPLKYEDWECDIMVSGLYLERMFRRADAS